MPLYSQESVSRLSTCHPDLQVIFFEVIRFFDCAIVEGYRNEEDQNRYFDEGKTQLRYPNGKHNNTPSTAVDAVPYPVDYKNINQFCYFAGFVKGIAERLRAEGKITYGIRWGGDWNNNFDLSDEGKFRDFSHFELV